MARVFTCLDPLGRTIVLDQARWDYHIRFEHAELAGQEAAVEATVSAPSVITRDAAKPDRVVYYRRGVVIGRYRRLYLKVVARLLPPEPDGAVRGEVITAHLTPKLKRGETHLWP